MPSALSAVPVARRKRLAPAFAIMAVLLIGIGVVSLTGSGIGVLVIGILALAAGGFVALIVWGLVRSVRIDVAEAGIDAAIAEAVGAAGGFCGCGHDHDPDELHVTGDAAPCAHDGAGELCAHTCESCVLARERTDAAG